MCLRSSPQQKRFLPTQVQAPFFNRKQQIPQDGRKKRGTNLQLFGGYIQRLLPTFNALFRRDSPIGYFRVIFCIFVSRYESRKNVGAQLGLACHITKVTYQEWPTFELPFAFVSKRVVVQNHSYENEFDLHEINIFVSV